MLGGIGSNAVVFEVMAKQADDPFQVRGVGSIER